MQSRAGESVKRASSDHALAPERERKTDTERETGRGIETGRVTINTVSTSRKATNEIAAAVRRGQRTRSTADIAEKKTSRQHSIPA